MEEQKIKSSGKEVYYYAYSLIRRWPCLEDGLDSLKDAIKHKYAVVYKSFRKALEYANFYTRDDEVGGVLCLEFEDDKCYAWCRDFPKDKIEITDEIPNLKNNLILASKQESFEEFYFYPFANSLEKRSSKEILEELKNNISSSDEPIKVYSDLSFLLDYMGDSNYSGVFFEKYNFLGIEKINGKYIGWLFRPSKYEFELPQEILEKISLIDREETKKLILK